ncbi:MAG: hypothetical protein A2Z18_03480 [Armatimonadetes bacterium RBG_16_58_9]|nr:MAG: hypothetical protein A2Z18_03480 [Armatimonadetes bacterium RBG_16_58_9]
MLINMVSGLVILAIYVYRGLDDPDQKRWAPAFAVPGIIALVSGFHMIWTWPLPGSYNSAYGEMTIFFGFLLAGAAVALAKGWNLVPLALVGIFPGLAAILIGVRLIDLEMTNAPLLSGIGFILTGSCGVFAAPVVYCRENRALRCAGVIVLVVSALIWALTGYMGYWMHMQLLSGWVPVVAR